MLERELERVRARAGGSNCRIPLSRIDAVVSAHLGPARVRGNAQPAVFYRQIAMYLAHHVGGWSTTPIGKFYNGRDHSTVCHAIAKIASLRKSDRELSSVIDLLASACEDRHASVPPTSETADARPDQESVSRQIDTDFVDLLADRIVDRLLARLSSEIERTPATAPKHGNLPPQCDIFQLQRNQRFQDA